MIYKSELLRKLIHLCNLIIPFTYLFYFHSKIEALIVLGPITLFALIIEYLRTYSYRVKNIFNKYLFAMLRKHEKNGKYTGATWVFIASTISIAVFPKEIAVISLVFMAIGDTTAGLIGRKIGKIKYYNKTLEGAFAGFVMCLIIGLLMDLGLPNIVIIFGALSAMIIEIIPVSIDDNLRIPLFSGTIMYTMSFFLV